jgi:hypothetical protein
LKTIAASVVITDVADALVLRNGTILLLLDTGASEVSAGVELEAKTKGDGVAWNMKVASVL